MGGRYVRVYGASEEQLDAIEEYIALKNEGTEIPEELHDYMTEKGLLEECPFDGCTNCEMFLFRTEGTDTDANGMKFGAKEVWHCDCGSRHIHYVRLDRWSP
jgi:protocatechuate 3,4-dioxygenase beta subunit